MSKENEGTLNGAVLLAWQERMGFSQREVCEVLGCSRSAWQDWTSDRSSPPRYIGLACAAVSLGMRPIGSYGEKEISNSETT
jgi:transcriptional regulator with XRE-family HTH domain